MSRICVAKILNAHGIKGLVKLRLYVEDANLIEDPDISFYKGEVSNETIKIKLKNPIKGDFLAEIVGVHDRNAAELLRHAKIYMDENALPDLKDDEVYHKDLIGLSLIDKDSKEPIGRVKSIQNFGAEDLFEIAPLSGNAFFLPFRDEFIVDINIGDKFITITGYEDYLD